MSVDTSRRYTVADVYRLFPEDSRERYELLDGVLYVTPAARRRHAYVVGLITYRLHGWTKVNGGRVYPGVNVDFSDDTHLEPDAVYSRSEDSSGLAFTQAPELIVEVSSPSTRSFDLGAKKDRYAAKGAEEFWFADLDADVILQFRLQLGGRSGEPSVHRRGETFTSPLFSGLVLGVDDLLGPPE